MLQDTDAGRLAVQPAWPRELAPVLRDGARGRRDEKFANLPKATQDAFAEARIVTIRIRQLELAALSLPAVAECAELLGGGFRIQGASGRGTVVHMHWPLADGAEE